MAPNQGQPWMAALHIGKSGSRYMERTAGCRTGTVWIRYASLRQLGIHWRQVVLGASGKTAETRRTVPAGEPLPAKPPQPAVVATEEPPPAEQPQPAVVATEEPPPPVVTEPAWYPGRVGWFYSETEIGWVPLAPQEQFYSVNYWGPQAVVADDSGSQGDDLPSYGYYEEGGVAVERDNLYRVDNYTRTRMTSIHDIDPSARTFKRMPTASTREAAASDKSRFSAGQTATGQSKPSQSVTSRIQQTKANASENSGSIKSSMSGKQTTKPAESATSAMKRPEAISKSANRVNPETNAPSSNVSSQPASGKADSKLRFPDVKTRHQSLARREECPIHRISKTRTLRYAGSTRI